MWFMNTIKIDFFCKLEGFTRMFRKKEISADFICLKHVKIDFPRVSMSDVFSFNIRCYVMRRESLFFYNKPKLQKLVRRSRVVNFGCNANGHEQS